MRELESRVTQDAIGGLYIGGQAQVDAYRLTLAFAQAAEALGVAIRYGEVTGLRTEGGRVKGLDTSLGPIDSDTVVLAIGSWSKRIEEWIGMDVPVEPLKGQTIHVEIPGAPLPCMIHHVDRYVAPKLGGTVITGTYDGFMGFDTTIHEQGIVKISEGVLSLCPGILESKVVSHVTGLRPASADWLPILGAVPSIDGAYIATGHQRSRHNSQRNHRRGNVPAHQRRQAAARSSSLPAGQVRRCHNGNGQGPLRGRPLIPGSMATLLVNGKRREVETPVDLLGYLASHKIEPRMIVIEYNGEIIKRDRWEGITLQDGDKLEIVHMVAGGAGPRSQ